MDHLSATARRDLMGRIRRQDTAPEIRVRRVLHRLGFRFRLHRRDLPGTPDILLPRYKTALFVHGCFWHRHPVCKRASHPATNTERWNQKFARNIERDRIVEHELSALGWRVAVIWECEATNDEALSKRLLHLLKGNS
ncbi:MULTISPECIES: DNA mismatch endonuclease Vsr [unclassified Mesorhizobium]|uniref:very short patch repair endonuclease n=1 Tax=unclassified Mesorhizobium TaxID=325217 RepID=UPI00112A9CFD|nr:MULTISPECIES: DNA mismatch endonuclease Vsr [unclassified Mesorhizobium]TPM05212.1 DNA mismatch endonuclease Vsr [Mesorhizobium sp. B2-3-8]TPM13177.1 DNA mismatch endonuclease Vsr [Mesorhizobium sp. B2-3-7]TPN67347.1 DNA mismatch endonuclease Vsr [Mesorhizobium sp. B1-1-1]